MSIKSQYKKACSDLRFTWKNDDMTDYQISDEAEFQAAKLALLSSVKSSREVRIMTDKVREHLIRVVTEPTYRMTCGMGRGRIASMYMKKHPEKFPISWGDIPF